MSTKFSYNSFQQRLISLFLNNCILNTWEFIYKLTCVAFHNNKFYILKCYIIFWFYFILYDFWMAF